MKTTSERVFEQACAATGISYRRLHVGRGTGHQRPDYKIAIAGCQAVIEVKEIQKNARDRQEAAEMDAGRGVRSRAEPGDRLRKAIRSAGDQLRRFSVRGFPTAVAMFDATFSLWLTDPYNVKTAMYGLDAITIALPHKGQPYRIGMKRAGKAVLTPEHNTSVSAVIIIRVLPASEVPAPLLLVYHNIYARVPFNADRIRSHVYLQYCLKLADDGASDWNLT